MTIKDADTKQFALSVIEGLHKKKAKDVISMDMSEMENAICRYFIICHGDSNTHVDGLCDAVEEHVREETGRKPYHVEGQDNSTWVLMDYGELVVHIFQKEYRDLYKLEDLWADAPVKKYDD